MVAKLARGLRQDYPPFGTYSALKVVPAALRGVNGLPRELRRSLQTSDYQLALRRLADVQAEFQAMIDAARAGVARPACTIEDVVEALESWRTMELGSLLGGGDWLEIDYTAPGQTAVGVPTPPDLNASLADARAFFEANPAASRELTMPSETAILLSRLHTASRVPSAWTEVPGFDAALDQAFAEVTGLEAVEVEVDGDGVLHAGSLDDLHGRALPGWLREQARAVFLPILQDVVQAREWARSRAAALLAAMAATTTTPDAIRLAPAAPAYTPREGDRTLSELADAFKAAKGANLHRYVHVIAALEEIVGGHKPVRAITRADLKAAVAYMRRIPTNYSKRWPGLTLSEAVEKADDEGLEGRLSPGSVDTYVAHMRSMFTWGVEEGWLDQTPAAGLKVASVPNVRRRAFATAELDCIFGALASFQASEPERWWVPALALHTGARLNELCQLRTNEVEEIDGEWVLNLSEFDANGRRAADKSLKTTGSERFVPLHPAVVAAGFIAYVANQREAGVERLFPRLKAGPNGGWSHEFSKWWGRFLDKVEITDAGATFHSFRHQWREQAALAGLSDRQIDAVGGWTAKGQAARYGRRTVVEELAPMVARIQFGGFVLPVV